MTVTCTHPRDRVPEHIKKRLLAVAHSFERPGRRRPSPETLADMVMHVEGGLFLENGGANAARAWLIEALTPESAQPDSVVPVAAWEGRKDDADKAPYDLLAPEAMEGIAQVLAFGAAKYEPRNWEKGMRWGRPFAALMRHMWAWWRGEKADPETGFSHLWHAGCCLMFLIAYEAREEGEDDRPVAHGRPPKSGEPGGSDPAL